MQQAGLRSRLGYSAAGASRQAAPADDDWLSDVGDVEWEDTGADRSAGSGENGQSLGGWSLGGGRAAAEAAARAPVTVTAPHDVVQRRRALAALVLVLLIGAAVAVPLLAFRGGGGSPQVGSTTPPAATTPATSTPATNAPAATPQQSKPSLTVQLPSSGFLKVGVDEPALVTALQRALTRLGYDPGSADGSFGAATKAAVIAFQQAKGLSADGVVGADTAKALNAALAAG